MEKTKIFYKNCGAECSKKTKKRKEEKVVKKEKYKYEADEGGNDNPYFSLMAGD